MIRHLPVSFSLILVACGGTTTLDAGLDASTDAPIADTSTADLAPPDAPERDALAIDAGAMDSGAVDMGAAVDAAMDAFATDAGTDAATDAAVVPADGPRPIAPLSTATVTSQRPTLRWLNLVGTDGVHVELCRDRALTTSCASFDATGTSAQPAAALTPGVWFWRLTDRTGAATGTRRGPIWQFHVGARSAPVDTSWGTVLDVNGDAYPDVLVGTSFSTTAFVYLGDATGLSTVPTMLTGPPSFGSSVAGAGDVNGDGFADVVVGAYDSNTAYVYLGSTTGIPTTAATTLVGPAGSGGFGTSVASAGDVNGDGFADVIVGAPGRIPPDAKAVYIYLGSSTGLLAAVATTLTGPTFGFSVASAGDVNGDGFADVAAGGGVYLGSAVGVVATAVGMIGAGPVASAGDVNGDGYADIVTGYPGSSMTNLGNAYVYLGGAAGPSGTPDATMTGPMGGPGCLPWEWHEFGAAVASAGDVNGDGFSDVVVGAPPAYCGDGGAYVYLGSATGISTTSLVTTVPGGGGGAVASAGDIDGDGFADVVVGAASSNTAFVFLGSVTGLTTTAGTTLTGPASSNFGYSVASAESATLGCRDDERS